MYKVEKILQKRLANSTHSFIQISLNTLSSGRDGPFSKQPGNLSKTFH